MHVSRAHGVSFPLTFSIVSFLAACQARCTISCMYLIDRILNWLHREPHLGPTIETVAENWSITPGHAEHYVQLYKSRNNLTYQQALNVLQDMSFEDVHIELGEK